MSRPFLSFYLSQRLLAIFLGTLFLGNGFYSIRSSNNYQDGNTAAELIIESRPQADWIFLILAFYFFGVATSSKVAADWLKTPVNLLLKLKKGEE